MFKDFATDSNETCSQQYVGSLADLHTDKYTLLYGDCLARMKEIPDGSVDMILCDLPYGTVSCKWDNVIPFEPLWKEYKRVAKDNAAIVLTSAEPFTSFLITSNVKMFKYDLIWHKTHPKGHLNAKKMPMRSHENVCVFYSKPPTYNPQKTTGHKRKVARTVYTKGADKDSAYGLEERDTSYDSTERYPTSVQVFGNADQTKALHPTQKPVALMEWLIRTYSNVGDIVLDNCIGSGTTGVACLNTSRKFIGIEMDENYFNIASKRIAEAQLKDETNA